MSDCYEWLDPFEERALAVRAVRRAAMAHEDGRQSVLRAIRERKEGDFRRALDHAVGALADRLADETLRPWALESFSAYENARSLADRRASLMTDMMRPAVSYLQATGEFCIDLKARADADDELMVVSYELKPPRFRSEHVAMSTMIWK